MSWRLTSFEHGRFRLQPNCRWSSQKTATKQSFRSFQFLTPRRILSGENTSGPTSLFNRPFYAVINALGVITFFTAMRVESLRGSRHDRLSPGTLNKPPNTAARRVGAKGTVRYGTANWRTWLRPPRLRHHLKIAGQPSPEVRPWAETRKVGA